MQSIKNFPFWFSIYISVSAW